MYKKNEATQISFYDFNQDLGFQLNEKNEWVQLAQNIPWDDIESLYQEYFPSKTGNVAKPARMVLGSLIIQKRKGLSDRALVKEITENPYLQFFIGLPKFQTEAPFRAQSLVNFRKRMDCNIVNKINELIIAKLSSNDGVKNTACSDAEENAGTQILDATCAPSNIRYPQDYSLLNEARIKLEKMIDYFCETYALPKPRTYRRIARKEYLNLAKSKKPGAKKIRATVRRMLGYVRRDIGYLEGFMAEGYAMPSNSVDMFLTILKLYEQQKYMWDNRTHRVANRIVSLSQPYLRPIVRGKVNTPVEFGAKFDVSIDENGCARMEKISFDPYNESTILKETLERYKERTGHYPERILVDKIYRTRENRNFCLEHNIRMSGANLGRSGKKKVQTSKTEYQDNIDRIEVERFFSNGKRCNGMGLIVTRLSSTVLGSIALSVLVTNLFSHKWPNIFWLFFWDNNLDDYSTHFVIFESNVA